MVRFRGAFVMSEEKRQVPLLLVVPTHTAPEEISTAATFH